MKPKLLACPLGCNKKFEKIEYLNLHIVKTGHNEGNKVTKRQILEAIGLSKITFSL